MEAEYQACTKRIQYQVSQEVPRIIVTTELLIEAVNESLSLWSRKVILCLLTMNDEPLSKN